MDSRGTVRNELLSLSPIRPKALYIYFRCLSSFTKRLNRELADTSIALHFSFSHRLATQHVLFSILPKLNNMQQEHTSHGSWYHNNNDAIIISDGTPVDDEGVLDEDVAVDGSGVS